MSNITNLIDVMEQVSFKSSNYKRQAWHFKMQENMGTAEGHQLDYTQKFIVYLSQLTSKTSCSITKSYKIVDQIKPDKNRYGQILPIL